MRAGCAASIHILATSPALPWQPTFPCKLSTPFPQLPPNSTGISIHISPRTTFCITPLSTSFHLPPRCTLRLIPRSISRVTPLPCPFHPPPYCSLRPHSTFHLIPPSPLTPVSSFPFHLLSTIPPTPTPLRPTSASAQLSAIFGDLLYLLIQERS